MLTVKEIRTFIQNDQAGSKKQQAMLGQRYYDGEHDIMGKRIFFINADGKLEEDLTKVNTRISHPFFRLLSDQTVEFLLSGKEGFIRSDDPKLQKELDARFNDNENFIAEIYQVIEGCIVKGFEYCYEYKDKNGRTAYQCADSLGVVEVREKDTDDGCTYVIYHYIDRIEKNSKEIRRIQVWDDTQTFFYCQVDDGEIEEDESEPINPRPHTILTKKGDKKLYRDGYGRIPFYRMDNNLKQETDLKVIKDLIDDYDLMNCGLSNNIEDTNEALYVVKGFEGDNLDELMMNIKAKRHIGVSEEGGVQVETVDIPVEARKAKMEIDEKNIFRFGFGLNTADLKDTSATTSIAIKAAYSLLDLKCNKLETRLKQFLRKLLDGALAEINKEKGTDYTQNDVYFKFEREIPTNAQEMAQIELIQAQKRNMEINTILNLAAVIDDETRLKLICEQLDIDYEKIKDKLPKPEDDDLYNAQETVKSIVPEDEAKGAEGDVIA